MATTLLDLLAKLRLDSTEYEEGLEGAEKKASGFGKVMSTVGKVGAAAFAAVGTAAVAVGKQSIDAYADFEQLSGGIETLYKDAQGGTQAVESMMENASNAWKTAGMSANEYMKMAIESSASLINSLGGDVDKASELMDQAIVDMSDNVNKMGTTMEGVQNAYRGFSRGNFTMLDNLALGFAGTKEGMQDLLTKAEEFAAKNGEVRDFSIDSYSDIIEAIHIVQTEMGITGTTAAEASGTISGSLSAMKAAWQNVLMSIADDNADFGTKIDGFVESVVQVGQNIIPRVETILQGLTKLVAEGTEKLLPLVIDVITTGLPKLVPVTVQLIETIVTSISDNIDKIIDSAVEIIFALADGLIDALPKLIPAVVQIILKIVEKLTEPDTVLKLVDAAIQIIAAIGKGLIQAIPDLLLSLGQVLDHLITAMSEILPQALEFGEDMINKFGEGIANKVEDIVQMGRDLVTKVKDGFVESVSDALNWGRDLISNFIDGIKNGWNDLKGTLGEFANKIADWIGFSEPKEGPLSKFHTFAPDMMKLFAQGIKDNEGLVTAQISKSFNFEPQLRSAAPALASGSTTMTNTWNITVNGIDELDEVVRWFKGRQVEERMA